MTIQTGFHGGGRNWSWSLTRVVATRASTVVNYVKVFKKDLRSW